MAKLQSDMASTEQDHAHVNYTFRYGLGNQKKQRHLKCNHKNGTAVNGDQNKQKITHGWHALRVEELTSAFVRGQRKVAR